MGNRASARNSSRIDRRKFFIAVLYRAERRFFLPETAVLPQDSLVLNSPGEYANDDET